MKPHIEIHPCSHPELTRRVSDLPSTLGKPFSISAVFATYACPIHEKQVHVASVVTSETDPPNSLDLEALVSRLRFVADHLEQQYTKG